MAFNGKRLKDLRTKRNMSQYQLAMETNIDFATICRLEKGISRSKNRSDTGVSFVTVEKIADYFKVNMETFKCGKMI